MQKHQLRQSAQKNQYIEIDSEDEEEQKSYENSDIKFNKKKQQKMTEKQNEQQEQQMQKIIADVESEDEQNQSEQLQNNENKSDKDIFDEEKKRDMDRIKQIIEDQGLTKVSNKQIAITYIINDQYAEKTFDIPNLNQLVDKFKETDDNVKMVYMKYNHDFTENEYESLKKIYDYDIDIFNSIFKKYKVSNYQKQRIIQDIKLFPNLPFKNCKVQFLGEEIEIQNKQKQQNQQQQKSTFYLENIPVQDQENQEDYQEENEVNGVQLGDSSVSDFQLNVDQKELQKQELYLNMYENQKQKKKQQNSKNSNNQKINNRNKNNKKLSDQKQQQQEQQEQQEQKSDQLQDGLEQMMELRKKIKVNKTRNSNKPKKQNEQKDQGKVLKNLQEVDKNTFDEIINEIQVQYEQIHFGDKTLFYLSDNLQLVKVLHIVCQSYEHALNLEEFFNKEMEKQKEQNIVYISKVEIKQNSKILTIYSNYNQWEGGTVLKFIQYDLIQYFVQESESQHCDMMAILDSDFQKVQKKFKL